MLRSRGASGTAKTPAASTASRRTLTVHEDARGSVRETFRASWDRTIPPIRQLVRSQSAPRTLRGMHLHRRQYDIWHFVDGVALVRLYDHATARNSFFWASADSTIIIPPGVSHGFYTVEGCVLLYALTEEYDGSDEYGWWPFDGLPAEDSMQARSFLWPRAPRDVIVSERDLRAPRLDQFVP